MWGAPDKLGLRYIQLQSVAVGPTLDVVDALRHPGFKQLDITWSTHPYTFMTSTYIWGCRRWLYAQSSNWDYNATSSAVSERSRWLIWCNQKGDKLSHAETEYLQFNNVTTVTSMMCIIYGTDTAPVMLLIRHICCSSYWTTRLRPVWLCC